MDIHRIVSVVLFIVLAADFQLCLSQQPTRSVILMYDGPLDGLTTRAGKISIGPNRQDASQMFNMLRSAGVRKELALDESQLKLVCKMFDDEPMTIQHLLRQGKAAGDAYPMFRQRNMNAMQDVITAKQSRRLHQIALRAEITVLGLPAALTEGRFGESIGINENQKAGLLAKGTSIELRKQRSINDIFAKTEDELLKQLREEQIVAAKRLIGAHFLFDDHYSLKRIIETILVERQDPRNYKLSFDIPVVGFERSTLDGKLTIGPNLENSAELFNFLRSESVRKELAFRDTPLQVLNTMLGEDWAIVREHARRGANSTDAMQVSREENGKTIGAMMTVDQTVRLKQLARRTEVACIGISRALTEGRLGDYVEINDSQRIAVSEKEREMEDRVQKELWDVMATAEIELLEVLTTQQRDTAGQALGKYYLYEDALRLKDFVLFKKMQNSDTSR